MSALSDAQVAQVARTAGFAGGELQTAIACAFAASGGVPAWDHPIYPGPIAHYKGLWGVDLVEWPDIAAYGLDSPHVAATAAYELTRRTRGFHWCPVYRAGGHVAYLDRAAACADRRPHREPEIEPTLAGTGRRAGTQSTDRLARMGEVLHSLRRWRV